MANQEEETYNFYNRLIERHHMLIRRLCWRHSSGSADLCKELVQDCYIVIWNRLSILRRDSHPLQQTAWLVWQCRSVFSHRQRGQGPELLPLDPDLADTLPAPEPSEQRELIEELAVDLIPFEREVLDNMLQGYTQQEIAKRLGCSPETIKRTKGVIIAKMKKTSESINHLK